VRNLRTANSAGIGAPNYVSAWRGNPGYLQQLGLLRCGTSSLSEGHKVRLQMYVLAEQTRFLRRFCFGV
jgi:hypothetical protein